MAPKKKGGGGAAQMTPEQIAAKRAAAMAMFNTGSTPRPAAAKPGSTKPAAAVSTAPKEDVATVDVSDSPLQTSKAPETDASDEHRAGAAGFAAETVGDNTSCGFVTTLPEDDAWVKILTIEPTPAMQKTAKKQSELETVQNGCRVHILKDVAYLYDAEGRSNVLCWRTKLEKANLGTGQQPMVRLATGKAKVITGKDSLMLSAIQTHSRATVTLLPTGHVCVLGNEEASASAIGLINDLVDGDGVATKETLAPHLVVAEPWSGEMTLPVPDEWVGAIIGKHGAGIKAIASESGALIDYVDPEEAAAKEGGAAADVAPSETADGGEEGVVAKGYFRLRGKFENQCTLAKKRIEERLALVQKLDVYGYVMVPKGVVGRLIGKGGSNIKLLQRTSGASRITFDKEPGNRAHSQACYVLAPDIEAAIGAAKVILEAVPEDKPEARAELKSKLENLPQQIMLLTNADAPVVDATKEQVVAAHRAKFGAGCLAADAQTKDKPADLAAVDYDVWAWQWAVDIKTLKGAKRDKVLEITDDD